MIVCSCFGTPCRIIRKEIGNGARSVEEIGDRCEAGTGCGACREQIGEMLEASEACPHRLKEDKPAAA